jgi:hypothetical protein
VSANKGIAVRGQTVEGTLRDPRCWGGPATVSVDVRGLVGSADLAAKQIVLSNAVLAPEYAGATGSKHVLTSWKEF